MAISKSTRILILLAVDTIFFFIELIVGYSVHSLALVADSFHMLNDVISLLVGLWAVKVANRDTETKMYTYGWQRAETLGALVNGVFLVALCLSIFLEAIQRFVEPQEVTQPKIILIVGCFGLLSNILGLFLFHDHGHGGNGHDHGEHDEHSAAENGHSHAHEDEEDASEIGDQAGNIADVLPQSVIAGWSNKSKLGKKAPASEADAGVYNPPQSNKKISVSKSASTQRERSVSHPRYSSFSEASLQVHPAFLRNDIINRGSEVDAPSPIMSEGESDTEREQPSSGEQEPLLANGKPADYGNGSSASHKHRIKSVDLEHHDHHHRKPKTKSSGHGHSHGDLNMRGVFLHVMGDALGNIGVIATALFIWLTDFSWRFYSDPAISLVITVIILCSAIPLCRAAGRILLQAVPPGLSIEEIVEDIEKLPGVISCHHVHVWQLSDTKLVASLHVMLAFNFEGIGREDYMRLAGAIQDCLKEYGIRSSTIQPEFCLNPGHDHDTGGTNTPNDGNGSPRAGSTSNGGHGACAMGSGENCANDTCCPPTSRKS